MLQALAIAAVRWIFKRANSFKSGSEYSDTFFDPDSNLNVRCPSLFDSDPQKLVYLSVIVPAYNEQERLPTMMDETLRHLQDMQRANAQATYEIIIVDDGSKDR